MKLFIIFLAVTTIAFSQNKISESLAPKGEHFVLYNKCLKAITFCEITQQSYTICGSIKNCYGLYVVPGDTFYLHIEDKNQMEVISSDISFGGYFSTVNNFIFQPVDNKCVPQQALQIVIPLTAASGSSFQIVTQNISYVNNPSMQPGTPYPFDIYVGGQQPQYTFALSDFTVCPTVEVIDTNQVNVYEIHSVKNKISCSPNPTNHNLEIAIQNFQKLIKYKLFDTQGNIVKQGVFETKTNTIQLNSLSSGLYFISFYLEEKLIEMQKIIITR